jgi:Nif-specific regulatory protein
MFDYVTIEMEGIMTDKKKKNPRKSTSRKKKSNLLDDLEADIQLAKSSEPECDDLLTKIKELESSKSTFEALLNISASINSTLNQRELLKKIVDAVIRFTDSERGFLMLRNDNGEYSFEISRTNVEKELTEEVFEVSRSVVERAAESGEPVSFKNIQDSELLKKKASVRALNLGSAYSVPLKYEDKLIGIIYVDSEFISERFTEADLPVLKAFGAQAAVAIENARRRDELESSVRNLKRKLAGRYEFSGIVGKSKEMREVIRTIEKVAAFPGSVFIHGESGVGKELVANAIHHNSPRKGGPFRPVNCGGIGEGVIQDTLCGHDKGAFTGADKERVGEIEAADGGTLFLDEVAELPMDMQPHLLRVLENQEVTRMGSTNARKVDVRIISASNKDLAKEVEAGRFREDLYHRIHVLPIHVPPLRKRPEDILVLVEYFLDYFSKLRGITRPELTRDAWNFLATQNYSGNVRGLKNLIERILTLDSDKNTIDAKTIKSRLDRKETSLTVEEGESLKQKLKALEAEIIRQTLILHSWNITETAKELKISRQSLHAKIKEFNISE